MNGWLGRMAWSEPRTETELSMTSFRPYRALMLWALLALPLVGCGKEPETLSISATTFNYSQDYLIDVFVNQKAAASLIKPAKLGEVKGGGGFICCVSLSPAWRKVPVVVKLPNGIEYIVNAPIRQPWPSVASYAVVYVLPDRRVMVEVVAGFPIPDPSQLAELQKIEGEIR